MDDSPSVSHKVSHFPTVMSRPFKDVVNRMNSFTYLPAVVELHKITTVKHDLNKQEILFSASLCTISYHVIVVRSRDTLIKLSLPSRSVVLHLLDRNYPFGYIFY